MVGVVLAAGAGTRLRPLTYLRPKPLCPVGDLPLVDHALARFDAVSNVAVNIHHGRDLMEAHLAGRAHLSVEHREALGTAGALGHLHDWIAGRPTIIVNGDTWCPANVGALIDSWDGERIRILTPDGAEFGATTRIAGALMPWKDVEPLKPEPSGLYEASWKAAAAADRIEVIRLGDGVPFADCGTPADYLRANMLWSGGESVIGTGAKVEGTVERSVVWPGSRVRRKEHLVNAIRAGDLTVFCR